MLVFTSLIIPEPQIQFPRLGQRQLEKDIHYYSTLLVGSISYKE